MGQWEALCGVSVGLWEGPVQGQCGCVGGFCLGTLWVCQGSLSGVSVDPSRSLCGVTGGPVLDQCGYVGGPRQCGSLWVVFVGGPPLLSFLHLMAGEGQGTLPIWFFAILSGSLLCHFSRQAP